jgi:hypothetical protein
MEPDLSTRATSREHLLRLEIRALEERDRAGYSKLPQQKDEARMWEAEAIWPEE